MKKKILFAYNAMNIGGSTTSLLSILNRLDYAKYDVDLLLNFNTGDLLSFIPDGVRLLDPAWKYWGDPKKEKLHRALSPRFLYHVARSKQIAKKTGVPIRAAQYREWKDIEFQRELPDEYDVAVAFLEGDRCKYVARHVKAKRKLAWIHINYKDSGFDPEYDRDTMCAFDRVCLVSGDCKTDFDALFPELADRTLVVENILAAEVIRKRAEEPADLMPDGDLRLVTVSRISFKSKALDRAVRALGRIKNEQGLGGLRWYIIGDGEDLPRLRELIAENGLDEHVYTLGKKVNPYPYLKEMTAFFLPSSWEGKPMCVTEGFIMGLPAIVTEYSSAREQVEHGVDGYVMENSEDGVYRGVKYVISHRDELERWRTNVAAKDYSNTEEIRRVEALIDG